MSESIWWPHELWWERKILPLGFITLSLRQLATLMFAFVVAFLVSVPFQFPIAGVSFGGRAAVFFIIFGVGYMISSRRVKLLPIELQAVYVLRTNGLRKLRTNLLPLLRLKKSGDDSSPQSGRLSIVQEMVVEDFKNPVPLIISDRLRDVQKETRVVLFLDDRVRMEVCAAPQKPRYRLLYLPIPEDVGTHQLTVRLDGSSEPLVSITLLLRAKTAEISESVIRTK
jgi:hypothetical protein